jgi:hypothetical protein
VAPLFLSHATTCLFTWVRWSCGHCTKTRIEYCSLARDLPPAERDVNADCHLASTSSDLNEHLERPCTECLDGASPFSDTFLPDYIRLYPIEHKHYGLHSNTTTGKETLTLERTASSAFYDAATCGIRSLTRALFDAEDHYRLLGSVYYSDSWFTVSQFAKLLETFHADSYSEIVSAFHGSDRNRPFLQHWERT